MPFPAPNTQPIFIRKPNFWTCELDNQTIPGPRVGSSVPELMGTGGPAGSLLEELYIVRSGNHPQTSVYFYLKNDTDLDYVICAGLNLPEVTNYDVDNLSNAPSTSVQLWKLLSPASCDADKPHTGLRLPPDTGLYAGLTNAVSNPIICIALGGDY